MNKERSDRYIKEKKAGETNGTKTDERRKEGRKTEGN
jgi:hypothetical protein